MNVLIVDTDKISVEVLNQVFESCVNESGTDDWAVLPKGIDVMQDVSVDWMKMIRDVLDEKIKALESDVNGENLNCTH